MRERKREIHLFPRVRARERRERVCESTCVSRGDIRAGQRNRWKKRPNKTETTLSLSNPPDSIFFAMSEKSENRERERERERKRETVGGGGGDLSGKR